MKKQIDATFVQSLILAFRGKSKYWKYVEKVLPHVLFEVQALGPEALINRGVIFARVRLDDGKVYKIKFVHENQALVLYRMNGNANGEQIAVITNDTPQEVVWGLRNPAKAA